MNYVLIDDPDVFVQLKPLTLNKPVSHMRCGILTIKEKWDYHLRTECSYKVTDYLSIKYKQSDLPEAFISSHIFPSKKLVSYILNALPKTYIVDRNEEVLAIFNNQPHTENCTKVVFPYEVSKVNQTWDLFLQNPSQIQEDFELLTAGRVSKTLTDPHNAIYNTPQVFVEENAVVRSCILNADQGPIYIGENAVVQEGSLIIGPAAICERSIVAWGSKIRLNTTIGPNCRVGGEVGSSIFFDNANKAHDGYLGNSIIGSWCNLGANTNNSNLKNDLKEIKMYAYKTKQLENSGQLFCGTIMGDYTKTGISTMLNTGTTIGVSANVFGAGFQKKFIDSFTWGGSDTVYEPYRFDKAIEVIRASLKRRNAVLDAEELTILNYIANEI
jgi:UDP-N-acetylglucosamine diphosphorylase / glucose-1-phosphate thymidylyltransferase / UDP-N-acetylgalactosamine diphosphorylase / glucosamine-1-phosphate N-acetyltransferase / galactosamine-1-phosphate N-acetyltransferase